MWRPKTALSPKTIALWLLRRVSCTSVLSGGRYEIHMQDFRLLGQPFFPTIKGPKYLQYSNSLNNTSIFHFLQLFSAMSSTSHRIYSHSSLQPGPLHCFEVFLNPVLPPSHHIIVIICPSCIRPLPQACHGSVRNIHCKRSKKQYVYNVV